MLASTDATRATVDEAYFYIRDKNKAVINALVALSNARANRNKSLYETNGIHDSASAVKKYVKGLFGFQSVPYRQISGLHFSDQKIK